MVSKSTSIVLVALLLCAGCSKNAGTSVRGTVTFNGQTLEKGHITFYPVEGTDTTRGAEIKNGSFKVANLSPGKRRILVTVAPEMEAREHERGVVLKYAAASPITSATAGNNQIIEIRRGDQVVDIALGSP